MPILHDTQWICRWQEKLFDVSDLQEVSKCGRIHVTLDYSFARKRLNVTVHEASEIPNQERGGSTNTQVRLALLPAKNSRHKTKIIRANENPKYDETFQFKLPKGKQQHLSPPIASWWQRCCCSETLIRREISANLIANFLVEVIPPRAAI